MSDKKLVWVVEDEEGNVKSNWSTGTRIYTRKYNACNRIYKGSKNNVVEYELVPTGKVYNGLGEVV